MSKSVNVFEAILKYGHDEDFEPTAQGNFSATDAPAGSPEKIEALRRRVELGLPLWHGEDRCDYTGLTGALRPRE
jgi:hypothetical protein